MSDQQGNYYGGGQPDGGQQYQGQYQGPGQGQPPTGQWVDPATGYPQQYPPAYVRPMEQQAVPFSAAQPVSPGPMSSSGGGRKSSPLFPVLLAAAVLVAAVFAFLWRSADSDASDAKKVSASAQTEIAAATKKAAADVADAKKAADGVKAQDKAALDAATAAAAKAKTDSDAAIAKAKADSDAAIAKAQADADAAIAKAKGDPGAAAGLQAKLDAANAALAAANAKEAAVANSLLICQGFAKSSNDIVPDLNNFVDLAAAVNNNNVAAGQAAINAINASGFDTNKNTWNTALNDCLKTPAP